MGNIRWNYNFPTWNNIKYKICKIFKEKLETSAYACISSTSFYSITYIFYRWSIIISLNSYFIWNFKNYCKKMNKNTSEEVFYYRTKKRSLRLLFISKMVHPAGVEPATNGFEDRYSIQLSYGCNVYISFHLFKTRGFEM